MSLSYVSEPPRPREHNASKMPSYSIAITTTTTTTIAESPSPTNPRSLCRVDMKHPCILKLMEVFNSPTHVFLAMEEMGGRKLSEEMEIKGRFGEDKARGLFLQVCGCGIRV